MMAPKVPTYNGRLTFANPRYLKQAQSEIPCLYAFPYDQSTHANRLIPDGEETLALESESRSKLNKDSQGMHADLKYIESLENVIDELESDKAKFSNMYDMILQESVSNEVMCTYLLSLPDLDALPELQCLYLHKVKECDCLEQKLSKQTESVSNEVHAELLQRFAKVEKHLISLEIALPDCKEQKIIEKCKGKSVETKFDKPSVVRQPNAQRIPKPSVLGINHKTNVSRPQLRSNQMKDKVVPHISQVKLKKNLVEDHSRVPSISNKNKSVIACNDSLNTRTSNANVVCATCGKCLVGSDHFGCVTKMLNDMNARTKKPTVVPISTRKPKGHTNKFVATPNKKKVASTSTNQKPKIYYRMLNEKTRKVWKWWIEQQCPSGYKWVPKTKMKWVPKVRNENVQKDLHHFLVMKIWFKVDSEPLNGSNVDISNQYECKQTLDASAGTLNLSAGTSFNPKEEGLRVYLELGLHNYNNEQSSSKLVLDVVPPADKTTTSRQ
nr:hypothetical protein [Tanacetum cinerariifolium]